MKKSFLHFMRWKFTSFCINLKRKNQNQWKLFDFPHIWWWWHGRHSKSLYFLCWYDLLYKTKKMKMFLEGNDDDEEEEEEMIKVFMWFWLIFLSFLFVFIMLWDDDVLRFFFESTNTEFLIFSCTKGPFNVLKWLKI